MLEERHIELRWTSKRWLLLLGLRLGSGRRCLAMLAGSGRWSWGLGRGGLGAIVAQIIVHGSQGVFKFGHDVGYERKGGFYLYEKKSYFC